jgi:hypothetical protein
MEAAWLTVLACAGIRLFDGLRMKKMMRLEMQAKKHLPGKVF